MQTGSHSVQSEEYQKQNVTWYLPNLSQEWNVHRKLAKLAEGMMIEPQIVEINLDTQQIWSRHPPIKTPFPQPLKVFGSFSNLELFYLYLILYKSVSRGSYIKCCLLLRYNFCSCSKASIKIVLYSIGPIMLALYHPKHISYILSKCQVIQN